MRVRVKLVPILWPLSPFVAAMMEKGEGGSAAGKNSLSNQSKPDTRQRPEVDTVS